MVLLSLQCFGGQSYSRWHTIGQKVRTLRTGGFWSANLPPWLAFLPHLGSFKFCSYLRNKTSCWSTSACAFLAFKVLSRELRGPWLSFEFGLGPGFLLSRHLWYGPCLLRRETYPRYWTVNWCFKLAHLSENCGGYRSYWPYWRQEIYFRIFMESHLFDACLSNYPFACKKDEAQLCRPQVHANLDWLDSLCSCWEHLHSLLPRLFPNLIELAVLYNNFLWLNLLPQASLEILRSENWSGRLWSLSLPLYLASVPTSFFEQHQQGWTLAVTRGLPRHWFAAAAQTPDHCIWRIYWSSL